MNISIYGHISKSAVQECVQALSERTVPSSHFRKGGPSPCVVRSNVNGSWKKSIIRVEIPLYPERTACFIVEKIIFSFSYLLSNKGLHSFFPLQVQVLFFSHLLSVSLAHTYYTVGLKNIYISAERPFLFPYLPFMSTICRWVGVGVRGQNCFGTQLI